MFFEVLFILFGLLLVVGVIAAVAENKQVAKMPPSQRAEYRARSNANLLYGSENSAMVCPHCQVSGKVHTKSITQKKGVSGAKATGAVLTGGVSLLATGLSRKENNTQAHCRNCSNTWVY